MSQISPSAAQSRHPTPEEIEAVRREFTGTRDSADITVDGTSYFRENRAVEEIAQLRKDKDRFFNLLVRVRQMANVSGLTATSSSPFMMIEIVGLIDEELGKRG